MGTLTLRQSEGYPQWLDMTCLHYWSSRLEHRGMKTWLNYIIDTSQINIGLQYIRYIDEYIPKLQIHQHSLLTRKVFPWTNFSVLVFFSVSTGSSSSSSHIRLQVIFIFKSSSYSSHLHLQVIFTFKSYSSSSYLHLQVIFIISRSRSSLEHHH